MASKRIRPLVWITSVAVVIGFSALADALRLFRPLPPAAGVLREMQSTWAAVTSYEAEVSTGQWGGGAPGIPSTARQWYWKDRDDLIVATTDLAGFRHAERWRGERWSYYQPGANIQVVTRLKSSAAVPYARWLVTSFPTMGDLVEVISSAPAPRVTGTELLTNGPAWVLELTPALPSSVAGLAASHPAREFYTRLLERPWKVWISRATHLPAHLIIPGPNGESSVRIGVENLKTAPMQAPSDWRTTVTDRPATDKTILLECDLLRGDDLPRIRMRIQRIVDAWRNPLMRRGAMPTPHPR